MIDLHASVSVDTPPGSQRDIVRHRLPWAWIIVAAMLVATFYPGIMSNDSLSSLRQARTWEFTTWHPPIMAILWAGLDRVVAGPALMLVTQSALYAIACARLCAEAFPATVRRFSPWLVIPAFGLFPPVMAVNGMIWKDVWMSGFLLLALGYLFRLAHAPDARRRHHALAMVVTACALATAFRHNALAATAGLLAGGCYFAWPLHRRWLRIGVACAMGVVVAIILYLLVAAGNRLVATPANVTTPILLHDIAGMIEESGEPRVAAQLALDLAPNVTDVDPSTFLHRLRRAYTPAAAGRLLGSRRKPDAPFQINVYDPGHDAAGVARAWRALVRRYPVAYLHHRTKAFACLMQLCGLQGWMQHSYVLNPRYALPDGLAPMQSALRRWFLNRSLAIFYAPVAWLVICLIGGIVSLARLARRGDTSDAMGVFSTLSAAGLAVSLFFSSPIESYRYAHWMIVCGWIVLWMLLERHLSGLDAARERSGRQR
jgi:hypothetical protein